MVSATGINGKTGYNNPMKVLIIKITSMGDIIHTLPALTAAKAAHPSAQFDWVVAPEFADLLLLHSGVHQAIPCPLRRWRGRYWQALCQGEVTAFMRALRGSHYDVIIDAQAALKTGLMARLARGTAHGYDAQSVREYGAHWGYQQRHAVSPALHAIDRVQQLFAHALDYAAPLDDRPDYGLVRQRLPAAPVSLPARYVVAIPNTTWPTKHWPESQWMGLLAALQRIDIPVLVPWGSAHEHQRALRWSEQCSHVRVLPKMNLRDCAAVLAQASATISVDTGLGHLAAALNTPSIHLYGPTHPEKIGARGYRQQLLQAPLRCNPRCKRICHHNSKPQDSAHCLAHLAWQTVWKQLQGLL